MRRFPFIRGVFLTVALFAAAAPARAHAATASIGCPAMAPQSGDTFVSDVSIDAGTKPLGAYTFNIT